jgi:excisionase family DNA binding protein
MSFGEILNIKEVSDYLKIPVSTVYKLIQEGKLPAVKLGKHWRLMKRDIDRLFVRPFDCAKPRLSRRGKEAQLRENNEQPPAFRPESREVRRPQVHVNPGIAGKHTSADQGRTERPLEPLEKGDGSSRLQGPDEHEVF